MDGPPKQDEIVSLKTIKELAAKHLGPRSSVRRLILSQPDSLPKQIAISKIVDFSILLEQELRE